MPGHKRKRKRHPKEKEEGVEHEIPAKRARPNEEGETSEASNSKPRKAAKRKRSKTPKTPEAASGILKTPKRTPKTPKTPKTGPKTPKTPRTPRTPKTPRTSSTPRTSQTPKNSTNPKNRKSRTPSKPKGTPKTPEETSKKTPRKSGTPKKKDMDTKTPRTSGTSKTPETPKNSTKKLKKSKFKKKPKKPKKMTKAAKIKEASRNRRKMRTSQSRRILRNRYVPRKGLKGKIKKLLMKKNLRLRRIRMKTRRPRMNDIRQKVVRVIERSLVETPKIPKISHLFTERDSMGTPRASLKQVLRALKISNFVKRTHLLKDNYMKSLSRFTTLFVVEEDEPNGPLYLKYWPIYDKEGATIYVDNLPEACCEQQLARLAACYGTIAELSVSRKGARWVRPRFHPRKRQKGHPPQKRYHKYPPKKIPLINVGNRPKPYGFVRFVDRDSADKMVRDFIVNDPSINYEKMEEKLRKEENEQESNHQEQEEEEVPEILVPGEIENLVPVVPKEFPRIWRFVELHMTKMLREIRFLKQRRKRRTWPMFMRLYRLQRRLAELKFREYRCLRRAGIIDPRGRVTRRERNMISRILPPESAISRHKGQRPPPSSPKDDEPSTSDGQRAQSPPFPYVINKIKKQKQKKKFKKKKLTVAEKKAKEERKMFRKQRKRKPKGTVYIKKWVNGKVIRKRRRRRKKQSRRLPKYIPGGQVRRFFQDIQVLSLKKYKELKEEYQELIRLEKERVKDELPVALDELDEEMNAPIEENPVMDGEPEEALDPEEPEEQRVDEQEFMDF